MNKKILSLIVGMFVILVLVSLVSAGDYRFQNSSDVDVAIIEGATGNMNVTGNLTLGQKISFSFGEMIDNIKNGWIRITGGLEVNGSVNISGTGNALYFPDGTNMTSASSGSGEAYVTYEEYDTGWLYKTSVWGNAHLGTDNSSTTSNLTHNLDAPLSDLNVHVFISTDGTDANSFEILTVMHTNTNLGLTLYGVDDDNIIVQTGASGISRVNDITGNTLIIDTEDWYYKIVVTKLTKSDNATNIIEEVGDDVYLENVSKNFGIGTASPREKLEVNGTLQLGEGKIRFNDTSDKYEFYNGSVWEEIGSGSGEAYVTYEEYDTGWINRSDWTNVHLGSNTTKNVDSNVTHNLDSVLSDLDVKILISTDGTDANSFEIGFNDYTDSTSGTRNFGFGVYQVDNNNIIVQTGNFGLLYPLDSTGAAEGVNTQDWHYRIVVSKLTKSDNATNIIEEVGDDIYLKNVSKNFGIGTDSPEHKLHVHSPGTGAADHSYLHFTTGDTGALGTDGLTVGIGANMQAAVSSRENMPLHFITQDSYMSWWTNDLERIRLTSAGNFGIGTTSPSAKLEVNGSVNISGTGAALYFPDGTNMTSASSGGIWENVSNMATYDGDVNITGSLYVNESSIYIGAGKISFNATSNEFIFYNTSGAAEIISVGASLSGGNVPVGAVVSFASSTCPDGWVAADGTDGTPDLRGIFVRGAGTSGSYSMANGTAFSATYGEYMNDSMQQITGQLQREGARFAGGSGAFTATNAAGLGAQSTNTGTQVDFDSSGSTAQGGARTGAETAPASMALIYCVKTSDDSENTTGAIGTLNDNVTFVQNVSHNFGIGTLSPREKLEVNGTLQLGEGKIRFNDTSDKYEFYNGSVWEEIGTGSGEAYVTYEEYDTGWISRSDWTNVHLGSSTSKNVDSNVTHNLDSVLSDLDVKVLVSTDGTDANSFETIMSDLTTSTIYRTGIGVEYVNSNNIKIQTGVHGIGRVEDDGLISFTDADDWYYKIVVSKLTKSDNATNIIEEVGGDIYLKNVSKDFGIGTSSPAEKLHVNGSNVLIESGATGSNNLLTLDAEGTSSENNIYFAEDGVDKWSVGTLDSNQNFRVVDRLNGYIPFQIEQGTGDNAFYVDNDSNVGIGTSSPSAKLEVYGSFLTGSGGTSTSTTSVSMGSNCDATGTAAIAMGRVTDATGYASTSMGAYTKATGQYTLAAGYYAEANGDYSISMGREINVDGENSFGISLNNPASDYVVTNNNTMAIMGGNVGIGTTSPSAKLDVQGDVNIWLG
ncbi:hypothetical protein KAS08_05595 [Candidatus Pacearchaeota archaeon]|nr:hypothetical protein [Candidatus Pacearchaeota archaeon]